MMMNLDWDLADVDHRDRQSVHVCSSTRLDLLCITDAQKACEKPCIEDDLMNAIESFRLKPKPSIKDIDNLRRLLLEFRHAFQEQKKWQLMCSLVIEQCHVQHEKVMDLLMSGMRTPCCDEDFEEERMEIVRGLAADASSPLVIDARSTECFQEICRMRRELLGMWRVEDEMHARIGSMMKEIELMHAKLKCAVEVRSREDAITLKSVVNKLSAADARADELDMQNTMMLQQAVDMNLLLTKQKEQIEACLPPEECFCSSDKCRQGLAQAVQQSIDEYVELQRNKRQRTGA